MKKSSLIVIMALVMIFGLIVIANAGLIDRGGGLIYCDDLDITLLQDASGYYGIWWNALDWAANLTYYDPVRDVIWDDWRLPSAYNQDGSGPYWGFNVTGSEMGHIYYTELGNKACGEPGWGLVNKGPFTNLRPDYYWSGAEYASDPDLAWDFSFYDGGQGIRYKDNDVCAWAVRSGDVGAPVPVPPTVLLMLSGMIGLIGIKRKGQRLR